MGRLQARFRRFKRKPGSDLMLYRALLGQRFAGLLDLYPSTTPAYSFRKLSKNTADTIDGSALTWFDQSGSNDATQTTPTNKPTVVASTPFDVLRFDGTDDYIDLVSEVDYGTGEFSQFAYLKFTSLGIVLGSTSSYWTMLVTSAAVTLRAANSGTVYNLTIDDDLIAGEEYLISVFRIGNELSLYINGAKQTTTRTVAGTDTFKFNRIGARAAGNNPLGADLREIVTYPSDQLSNREGIEGNIWNAYNSDAINLFVLAGQSNMVGAESDNNPPTAELSDTNDSQILYNCSAGTPTNDAGDLAGTTTDYETNGWIRFSQWMARSRVGYGPDIDFIRELSVNQGYENIAVVKWARNGTNLGDNWNKDSSKLYPSFTTYVNNAIQALLDLGYDVNVRGIFWFQGHGDTGNDTYALNYGTNFSEIITDFRADITSASPAKLLVGKSPVFWKLPFEAGEPDADPQKLTNIDNVRSGQEAVVSADSNALIVSTDSADYIEPWVSGVAGNRPIHLTSDSKQDLGVAIAQAFVS